MNHKGCVLYQDFSSTYERSSVPNLVISAKSEHSNPKQPDYDNQLAKPCKRWLCLYVNEG